MKITILGEYGEPVKLVANAIYELVGDDFPGGTELFETEAPAEDPPKGAVHIIVQRR